MNREEAKVFVKELLLELKEIISDINSIAIKYKIFEQPTRTLDLSCECDELVGLINQDTTGENK